MFGWQRMGRGMPGGFGVAQIRWFGKWSQVIGIDIRFAHPTIECSFERGAGSLGNMQENELHLYYPRAHRRCM
jgi:hypothetical protein